VTLGHAVEASRDGALHYVCMDWRHLLELLSAGREVYDGFLNLSTDRSARLSRARASSAAALAGKIIESRMYHFDTVA
jgi:hypothetical protein